MHCIVVGIYPPGEGLWSTIFQKIKVVYGSTVNWMSYSFAQDEDKLTLLLSAATDAPVDGILNAIAEAIGNQFSCECWATAPAPLPLRPYGGYEKEIIYSSNNTSDTSITVISLKKWAPQVMRQWGIFVQDSLIDKQEVLELKQYIDEEIIHTENALKKYRPEISLGKDTFHFREMASRGNGRFDLLINSSSLTRKFVDSIIIRRVQPLLEKILGSDDIIDFDISVVYSKPGAQHQGWHADGNHQKGAKDAGWDFLNGWKDTFLADPYALCLFIPLIDLNDETGYTQFWPASHRNRDLMGFGTFAEIAEANWDGKCQAGDAIWYDYRLIHRGMANTSLNIIRPVVQILFKKKWYVEKSNYGDKSIAEIP